MTSEVQTGSGAATGRGILGRFEERPPRRRPAPGSCRCRGVVRMLHLLKSLRAPEPVGPQWWYRSSGHGGSRLLKEAVRPTLPEHSIRRLASVSLESRSGGAVRFRNSKLLPASLCAVLLGAGCGGKATTGGSAVPTQFVDEPAIVDLTDPAKPPPAERFLLPEGGAKIAPGDQLELRILGFPELSGQYLVAQDGRINLSLVGSVQASGKSVEELDHDLTSAFSTYYRNLDLAINVAERADRYVYVLGEVSRPGRFDFATGERVIHALAGAGGMTGSARENSIMLLRREQDGLDHAYRLDFSQVMTQLAPRDIYLQPGDVVFVPKSRFKTATDFAKDFLEVLGRGATTALVIDDLSRRTRALSITR